MVGPKGRKGWPVSGAGREYREVRTGRETAPPEMDSLITQPGVERRGLIDRFLVTRVRWRCPGLWVRRHHVRVGATLHLVTAPETPVGSVGAAQLPVAPAGQSVGRVTQLAVGGPHGG